MAMTTTLEAGRPPQQLRDDLWLFPPNRDSQGGSSWWLDLDPEPVLVDCPPLTEASLTALRQLAGTRSPRILLTSREGHGRLRRVQERLGWPVLVQEQEAYLLPNVEPLDTFAEEHTTVSGLRLLWTPGPTPGSCVVFAPASTTAANHSPWCVPRRRCPTAPHWAGDRPPVPAPAQAIPGAPERDAGAHGLLG